MKYYFDTSALIKNYIEEPGSDQVTLLLNNTEAVIVSELTLIECFSTLRRILLEKLISEINYENVKNEIKTDFQYFTIIDLETAFTDCERLIDIYQLKTLDTIQLSSALNMKNEIEAFISCDKKLLNAAEKEQIRIINPLHME